MLAFTSFNKDLLLFTILQYFGHVFLAINGDSSEREEFMFRKLAVLHRIIGFAFGPAVKELVTFHFPFHYMSYLFFEYCQSSLEIILSVSDLIFFYF